MDLNMLVLLILITLTAGVADATLAIAGSTNGSIFNALDGRAETLECSHAVTEQPLPTLTWECYNGTVRNTSEDNVTRAEVTWTADRQNEARCTCRSSHPVLGNSLVYVDVRVLYPPTLPTFNIDGQSVSDTVYVIQGSYPGIYCNSTGSPSPTYTWSPRGDRSFPNTQLTIIGVQPSDNGNYTCTAANTMEPTNGQPLSATNEATITLETLVPPSQPTIHYGSVSGPVMPINTYVFRGGDSLSLHCATTGNPEPTYQWTLNNAAVISNSSTITLQKVPNYDVFKCNVYNTMSPSTGSVQNRSSAKYTIFYVLYPPKLRSLSNKTVVENQTFSTYFGYESSGNPAISQIRWTRMSNNETFDERHLTFSNVTRQHAGTYKFTVTNEMNTTFDGYRQGVDSKTFELTVQYAASIVNFTFNADSDDAPLTVAEFSHITLACHVDSIPGARITISRDDTEIAREISATLATYAVNNATCLDAGVYTCAAANTHNRDGGPVSTRQLLVRCPPRPLETPNNLTYARALGDTVTLSLAFLAYPSPLSYSWQKLQPNDAWTDLTSGVNSDTRHSNITLQNIQPSNFGQYRVKVFNPLGILEHLFFLAAQDKPQIPTRISIIAETVTTNSAIVTWVKSFNGGLEQTFYVEYRPTSETAWSVATVSDSAMTSPNVTLVQLRPATGYTVQVHARNSVGASGKSESVTFTTKALPVEDPPSPVGAIVGGIFGVAAVAAIVVVLVVTQRRYHWTNVLREIPQKFRKRESTRAPEDIENDNKLPVYDDVAPTEPDPAYSGTELSEVEIKTTGYANLPASRTKTREYENLKKTAGGMEQGDAEKNDYEALHHTASQKKLYDSLKRSTGEDGKDGSNRTDYENLKKINRGNKPKVADIKHYLKRLRMGQASTDGTSMSAFEDYNTTSCNYDNQRFAMGADVAASMIQFHCRKPLQQIHLLDAGCGTGNYAKAMLDYGIGHVTLIDGSEGMLQKARAKMATEIADGRVADVRQHVLPILPYEDATFDAVMFNMMLHHLETDADGQNFPGTEQALKEARRVLKVGGVLSISTCIPSEYSPKQWYERLEVNIGTRYYKKFLEVRQWIALLNRCGFNSISNLAVNVDQPASVSQQRYDPEGPARKAWRDADSYGAVATDDEINNVETKIQDMRDNGTLVDFMQNHDKTNGFYDVHFIFAKAL